MPTLQFKGKNIIWNHHLSIPYHTLNEIEKLHFKPEEADGNLIIEGDNLLALKALLPQYAGKVKCIYIDPPYNTGNEGWVYNDNVNSPMLKDWLGKEVGKDDLTRHDKWLCMIVPRLKLLRELLADDGAIFISIDDNEQHILRMTLDELFGEDNFVSNIIWQKKFSPQNDAKYFSDNHDFIICYAKKKILNGDSSSGWVRNLLPRTEEHDSRFSNPDNDPRGDWTSSDFTVKTYSKEYDYPITTPNGRVISPTKGRCWQTSKDNYFKLVQDNRIWFGDDGNNVPRLKKFISEVQEGIVPLTIWLHSEVGHNQQAKQEIKEIFNTESPFESPKPVGLLTRIVQITSFKDSIILDSFAGSGTTMHAVMDLNKEDGGHRKCIMIQMTEATESEPKKNICKDITRERVKRAIDKYGYDSGFQYFKVGIPIDAETLLSGNLPTFKQFADYVYYLCTGENLKNKSAVNAKSYFVGEHGNAVIYLVYKQNFDELTRMALNLSLAEKIIAEHPKKKIIVYAPACFLEEDYMKEKNIDYVGIPYNLFRRAGV
jgi:adenine-specific DNA-methyltransferase